MVEVCMYTTVLMGAFALCGWVNAYLQYRKKNTWKNAYEVLKDRRSREAINGAVASAGAYAAREIIGAVEGIEEGGDNDSD